MEEEKFKPLGAAVRIFDVPSDEQAAAIDMVHNLEKGGIYTWLRGYRHPFYGFPERQRVETMADIKQFIPIAAKFCFEHRSTKILLGLLFLGFPKLFNRLAERAIDSFLAAGFGSLQRCGIDPKKYTRPVRELHDILTQTSISGDFLEEKGRLERLRDVSCSILQYDNAYLLRIQDAFGAINPYNFKKDPIGELRNGLNAVIEREYAPEMKQKMRWLRDMFCLFLQNSKRYKAIFKQLAKRLNVEKMQLDESDMYYCRKRKDYDFSGHREKRIKNFGLPTKLEIIMEEAILKRLASRETVVQQEFNNLAQQREQLIMEERKSEDAKQQRDKKIVEIEKAAEVLRGRWAEITEEKQQILDIKANDEKNAKEEKETKQGQAKEAQNEK